MDVKHSDYSNRVVVFIDILGFGNMVNESVHEDGTTNQKRLSLIFDTMKALQKTWDDMFEKKDKKKVTLFSDSAIISFKIEESSEVFFTLIELLHLTMELLKIGVLIRGGISVGKCIHDQSTVFGPAVNQAVKMEKVADYPRIIIDPEVINVGMEYRVKDHSPGEELEYLKELYRKDKDGKLYLDYFSSALSEVDTELDQFVYIHHLYNLITTKKNNYRDNENILKKYEWMQNKYNEMVKPMISKQVINRALKYDPLFAEALQSLRLIS